MKLYKKIDLHVDGFYWTTTQRYPTLIKAVRALKSEAPAYIQSGQPSRFLTASFRDSTKSRTMRIYENRKHKTRKKRIVRRKRRVVRRNPESSDATAVVFRTFRGDNSVIALFPYEPGTNSPYTMMSYQHIGQHGASDMGSVSVYSRASKPDEIRPLRDELIRIGYKLKIMKRIPGDAITVRREKLNRIVRGNSRRAFPTPRFVGKGEHIWKQISRPQRMNFLIESFRNQITDRSKEILATRAWSFLPSKVKIVFSSKVANVELNDYR